MSLSRRNWIALAFAPALPLWALPRRDYRFQHDYILGTSLDLSVLGASKSEANAAERAALDEVARLNAILNTRDPDSEISRAGLAPSRPSQDLQRVLAAYQQWERATHGAIRAEIDGRINVDALGKAYIVDRAAEAARAAAPHARGLVLDIGGDIRIFGETLVGIADPGNPADNAAPLTHVRLSDRAIATSGTYARGAHIVDPRRTTAGNSVPGTGPRAQGAIAASVTAPDCVSANALSTALCVLSPADGLRLLEETPGAEGLLVTSQGGVLRSSGFRRYEEGRMRPVAGTGWPNNYQVSITFTLKDPEPGAGRGGPGGGPGGGKGPGGPGGAAPGGNGGPGGFGGGGFGGRGGGFGRVRRPYVAVWAEDSNGKVVRTIALWADKGRYIPELRSWSRKSGTGGQAAMQIARATRNAGQYTLAWNGQNDAGEALPSGAYTIWIETNREHGTHYQSSAAIECGAKAAHADMPATTEFADIKIEYGTASAAPTV